MNFQNMTLEQVQRWVMSLLICAVATFPSGALVVYCSSIADKRRGDAIILFVMMGVIGMLAAAAVHLVNRRTPTVLTLIGAIPAVIAAVVVLS